MLLEWGDRGGGSGGGRGEPKPKQGAGWSQPIRLTVFRVERLGGGVGGGGVRGPESGWWEA